MQNSQKGSKHETGGATEPKGQDLARRRARGPALVVRRWAQPGRREARERRDDARSRRRPCARRPFRDLFPALLLTIAVLRLLDSACTRSLHVSPYELTVLVLDSCFKQDGG